MPAFKKSKKKATGKIQSNTEGPSSSEQDLSSVLYVGHLPYGFYEKALLGYFSQFGKVKHLRVSRSKTTARARGYAFLEFSSPDVAKIVAEAMDGYMLLTQKLVARVMKKKDVHVDLFKNARARLRPGHWADKHRETLNRPLTMAEWAVRVERALKRDKARMQKITAAGIDYIYDGLEAKKEAAPKKVIFD